MWQTYYMNYERGTYALYLKANGFYILKTKKGPDLAFRSMEAMADYIESTMWWWER